jgi:hypothetical protein
VSFGPFYFAPPPPSPPPDTSGNCEPNWFTSNVTSFWGSEFTADDLNTAARVTYGEGSGEAAALKGGYWDQQGKEMFDIAAVIYNRLNQPGFGNLTTLTQVVSAPNQYIINQAQPSSEEPFSGGTDGKETNILGLCLAAHGGGRGNLPHLLHAAKARNAPCLA